MDRNEQTRGKCILKTSAIVVQNIVVRKPEISGRIPLGKSVEERQKEGNVWK